MSEDTELQELQELQEIVDLLKRDGPVYDVYPYMEVCTKLIGENFLLNPNHVNDIARVRLAKKYANCGQS